MLTWTLSFTDQPGEQATSLQSFMIESSLFSTVGVLLTALLARPTLDPYLTSIPSYQSVKLRSSSGSSDDNRISLFCSVAPTQPKDKLRKQPLALCFSSMRRPEDVFFLFLMEHALLLYHRPLCICPSH